MKDKCSAENYSEMPCPSPTSFFSLKFSRIGCRAEWFSDPHPVLVISCPSSAYRLVSYPVLQQLINRINFPATSQSPTTKPFIPNDSFHNQLDQRALHSTISTWFILIGIRVVEAAPSAIKIYKIYINQR